MKLSIVLSTHATRFGDVALKGDFQANIAKIAGWGYDGVELAIRDPQLVDADELERVVAAHGLAIPAIGTGQAWNDEGLSYTDPDPGVRAAAIERTKAHIPLAARVRRGHHHRSAARHRKTRGGPHTGDGLAGSRLCRNAVRQPRPHGVRIALEPLNRYETS